MGQLPVHLPVVEIKPINGRVGQANAGGVICPYFEWVQGLQWFFWDVVEVRRQLAKMMRQAFNEVWSLAGERNLDLRVAAYRLAVHRVAEAIQQRSLFP